MSQSAILIAVLAAVGGGAIAALISGIFARPKSKAETSKLVAEAGQSIDDRWKGWANELEERLSRERAEHREELAALQGRVAGLEEALRTSTSLVDRLRQELLYARRITRSLVVWAMAMRTELEQTGRLAPPAPRHVEDYVLSMDERADQESPDSL